MCSTALVPMTEVEAQAGEPFRAGFDPARAGIRAECDGGAAIAGTRFAGRQFFAGTLTGDYRDYGIYPVSYTPLRAHETVLDLVCRLLLEKKNNKRTKSTI